MKQLFIAFILLSSITLKAQTNHNVQALFIYQFTKLLNWPDESKAGMFRIGVIGSFDAYKEISEVTMGRNVGSQNIEVMNVFSIDQLGITTFNILVVGEEFCNNEHLRQIKAKLTKQSTLIVTSKANFKNELACIGFEGEGKNFVYNYSMPCIQEKGLVCSKNFLSLGIEK